MIDNKDIKKFWNFLYGIEGKSQPEEGNKHFSIVGDIVYALAVSKAYFEIDTITTDNPKRITGFIKLTGGKDTLEKHIRQGNISINTLNTILCYYFYSLGEEKGKNIQCLEKLVVFFDILNGNKVKPIHLIYTQALIDHLLSKVKLHTIHCKISKDWNLSFFCIDDNGIEQQLFNSSKEDTEIIKATNNTATNSYKALINYKNTIRDQFKETNLEIADFSLSFEKIVPLPLIRIDKKLSERLKLLELTIKNPKNDMDQGAILEIEKEISKIHQTLSKENAFFDLLEAKQDVFIESKAGSGKTTLLQWIAYTISDPEYQNPNNIVPVFIELHSYKSDLLTLIDDTLKDFKTPFNELKNRNILLLIDGFDEYSGDKQFYLIQEIRSFKKQYNCQIVFSGRFRPKELGEKEFITYKLSPFSSENVRNILLNVFGETGGVYFEEMKKADLLSYLDTPLYLILLIAHIQKLPTFDLRFITPLLVSKGKLMRTVLIDEFLKNYEHKHSHLDEERWKDTKAKQIDLISYYAYYLTFSVKEKESLIDYEAEDVLHAYSNEKLRYRAIDIKVLLKDFEKHNILFFKRGAIGFNKKEFRLFFTTCYLLNEINSEAEYLHFKRAFRGNKDSWHSVKKYLFGLIQPSKLMHNIEKYYKGDYLLFSKDLLHQLELSLEFLKAKNVDSTFELHNKIYFLNLIAASFLNDAKYEKNDHKVFSSQPFLELFKEIKLKYKTSRNKKMTPSEIMRVNRHYFYSAGGRNSEFISSYELADNFFRDENRNCFKNASFNYDNIKMFEYDLTDKYIPFRKIADSPDFLFTLMQGVIFNNIFKAQRNEFYIRKAYKVGENPMSYLNRIYDLKKFLIHCFQIYPNEFLNFYFTTNIPSISNLKTLYRFYKKNDLKLDTTILTPATVTIILEHIHYVGLNNKSTSGIVSDFVDFIRDRLDHTLQNKILDSFKTYISNEKENIQIRINFFRLFYRLMRSEDIPLIMDLINEEDIDLQWLSTTALIYYLSFYYNFYADNSRYKIEVMEALHRKFKNPSTPKEFKIKFLAFLDYYRVQPTKEFKKDILDFSDNRQYHHKTAISFFGNCRIQESIPYLGRIIVKEENSKAKFWAYEALFKIDYENYYSYQQYFIAEKIAASLFLEVIHKKRLKAMLWEDADFLYSCFCLGDEKFLELLKEIQEIPDTEKPTYSDIKGLKELKEIIKDLEWKVRRLKECESYPLKKPSDNSEG